jgi:hypothetical protein
MRSVLTKYAHTLEQKHTVSFISLHIHKHVQARRYVAVISSYEHIIMTNSRKCSSCILFFFSTGWIDSNEMKGIPIALTELGLNYMKCHTIKRVLVSFWYKKASPVNAPNYMFLNFTGNLEIVHASLCNDLWRVVTHVEPTHFFNIYRWKRLC